MSGTDGDLRAAGERIEALLDELDRLPDRRAGRFGEELVRLLTDLYGAGLERVLATAAAPDAPRGEALLRQLAADDLVGSLLLVHDLHPQSLRHRLGVALEDLRESVPGADVRLLGLDEESGTVRVRMLASEAPPGAAAGMAERVRAGILAAVPDVVEVEVEWMPPPTPVRLVRRPQAEPAEAR